MRTDYLKLVFLSFFLFFISLALRYITGLYRYTTSHYTYLVFYINFPSPWKKTPDKNGAGGGGDLKRNSRPSSKLTKLNYREKYCFDHF